MPRCKTPSFTIELPVVTDSFEQAILTARFEAGRQLYNVSLGKAKKRLQLVRESELYQQARQIPRVNQKARNLAFNAAKKAYRYSEYDLHAYAGIVAKSCWIGKHLDVSTIQTVATRAFRAVEKMASAQAKSVRFKGKHQFSSLEGKTLKQGLRWKQNAVVWGSLTLRTRIDWTDPVIKHGLDSRIKYVRLVRWMLRGKCRWFVQLICEGLPYRKPKNIVRPGVIGLDLGPSTVALVGDDWAKVKPFCPEIDHKEAELRKLQRQMARQSRANNPDHYEPDFRDAQGRNKQGKVKKGRKKWKHSRHYLKVRAQKAEIERRQKAHRKSLQRHLVNQILAKGCHLKMENVSLKGWQKLYGKSIGRKAPGLLQSELVRKAASAGGTALKFSTRKTKLSQTCLCGRVKKKPLSQRVHCCECGITMHRDLFSGFLSRYVDAETETLSFELAQEGWLGLEPVLQAEWKRHQTKPARQVSTSERTQPSGSEWVACASTMTSQTETARLYGS